MKISQRDIYDRHGSKLVDQVELMEEDGMDPELAMALLLDKAIDLTFHVTGDERDARTAVEQMTNEKAKAYYPRTTHSNLKPPRGAAPKQLRE